MIDIEIWTFKIYIIDIKVMIHKRAAYPALDDDFIKTSEK